MRGKYANFAYICLDELHQIGLIGLVECVPRYDPVRGKSFDNFLLYAADCAMRNFLRREARNERRKRITPADAVNYTERARDPDAQDPSDATNWASDPHQYILSRCQDANTTTGLDPLSFEDPMLELAVSRLPWKLRTVARMFFLSGGTHEEVAAALGVHPSRAGQLRQQVIARLKAYMESKGRKGRKVLG